jgi:predicted nucleotidyltransferase component of viral defense system
MISDKKIQEFAVAKQTTALNVRREYIQHLFLSYFYQQPEASNVFFKGGTALRIAFTSPRFSEDLDFSATLFEIEPLEKAVLNTLSDVEKEGIPTEIRESKKTSGGYLAIISFTLGEETVAIQLEVSLRQGDKSGEVVTIASDFIPTYTITVLKREQLIGEKIQALLTRQKPRDFYDLYFIIRANLLTQEEKTILKQAREVLKETKINFDLELKQFLPKNQWAIIKDFKANLERELERFT